MHLRYCQRKKWVFKVGMPEPKSCPFWHPSDRKECLMPGCRRIAKVKSLKGYCSTYCREKEVDWEPEELQLASRPAEGRQRV